MYLTCPICGNDTLVNRKFEKQRCMFCRKKLKLVKNKKGKKSNKFIFALELNEDE